MNQPNAVEEGHFAVTNAFRKLFFSAAIALLVLTGFCFTLSAKAQGAAQVQSLAAVRIAQPVDDSSLVTLKGAVHPLANAQNDAGPLSPDTPLSRVQLVLKRSPQQESALEQLIQKMHTPGTANYHKWLSPTQFGQQFGPADQDIQTIENWVSSHGFAVEKLSPDKGMLEISGTVGQLQETFHVSMHKYLVNGQEHYANSNDPQIPSALSPVLGGFVSLNNFPVHRLSQTLGKATYNPQTGQATPEWTQTNSGSPLGYDLVVSPQDYYVQYDLSPLYGSGTNGTGQTIAIINDSNINLNFVNNFRSLFNLPANPPQVIIDGNDPGIDGTNNPDGPNGDSIEAYLDVEWAGAVAPAANIDLVIGADTAVESGLILAAERAVYSDIAPVMSVSFGACEASLGSGNDFLSALWEQAAAEGITVSVASGDSGSAGTDPSGKVCDNPDEAESIFGTGVNGFASTPYDVAVGGTDFSYGPGYSVAAIQNELSTYWNTSPSNTPQASLKAHLEEQPWNDSILGFNLLLEDTATIVGGGGGPSTCGTTSASGNCVPYSKPTWQTGYGVPNDSARDIPDVSLFAADGINVSFIPICASDGDCQPGANPVQITGVGGTSASAPSFAGIMALVNQKYGPQGQADYTLYPLATQHKAAFYDVTGGTNAVPCSTLASTMPAGDCLGTSNVEARGEGELKGYEATPGYDPATGWGSVDANQLVTNWNSVSFTSTSTTLTPSSTSFPHGTAITISGSVTGSGGTPTGSIALMTSSPTVDQAGIPAINQQGQEAPFNLTNGSTSGSVNYLPGGTYDIWGQYSGDGKFGASTSSRTQITVNPENSSIVLQPIYPCSNSSSGYCLISSGTNDVPYGTRITLDGDVVPSSQYTCWLNNTCATTFASATGSVTFLDKGSAINTAVISSGGDAEYTSGSFALGSHSITATYPGDASFSSSSARATTFTVVQATPTVSLASNLGGSGQIEISLGQTLVLTAMVTGNGLGAAPTGSVTFMNRSTSMGTVNLLPGVNPSTGAPVGIATLPISNVSASASANTTGKFGWIVAGGGATLACVFLFGVRDGRRKLHQMLGLLVIVCFIAAQGCGGGSSSSSGGSGSGGSVGGGGGGGTGTTGTMTILASYSGDTNYVKATSSAYAVTIATASSLLASTTSATASASATSPTAAITVSVTVTGQSGHAAPTGLIDFQSSGQDYKTSIPIVAGSGDSSIATITLNSESLPQGTNNITLQYLGDDNYQPSSYNLTINNPLSDFSMVAQSPVVITPPGSATDTINLTSVNGFSSSVAFTCSAPISITCSVNPSTASLTANGTAAVALNLNTTAPGSYTVVVTGTEGAFSHNVAISVQVQ